MIYLSVVTKLLYIVDTQRSIETPDSRLTNSVFDMLSVMCSASVISSERITSFIVPKIIKAFNEHQQVNRNTQIHSFIIYFPICLF